MRVPLLTVRRSSSSQGSRGRLVHHVSLTVEPEDVVPDAARAARLQFVFVSEEFLTSETTSIVETPVSEHTQKGAFTRRLRFPRLPPCSGNRTIDL